MRRISSSKSMLLVLGLLLPVGCAPGDGAANADPAETAENAADKKSGKKKHPANRLAKESSPYLLLHAHNPVDWYPWGPEAFKKAKTENKPIFLSIGYSSCHWCHVMERLVFENEEIAKLMNKHFINVKVDREERPDIDDIYMTSLTIYFQAIGSPQGGGWPLSMFLTPEGKPFAGGTYFPPEDKPGRLGFKTVLKRINRLWATKEKGIRSNADRLTEMVRQTMKPRPVLTPVKLDQTLVADVADALIESHDTKYGGIDYRAGARNPSKFPVPAKLALLQFQAEKAADKEAAQVLDHTLDHIAAGGIHDHLGGGFHRYSTDRYWHVPHFEKMLYDQAQLADVYLAAYRRTGKTVYREAAEGVFRFVLRDFTSPQGGFYSALDAETEGTEGQYYVWSRKDVQKVLGEKDAKLFGKVYGMDEPQRFEHGYVLHLPQPLQAVAKERKIPLPELKRRLAAMRRKLLAARKKRPELLRDDKILTSWNGLMIRAFANAGRILKEPKYIKAAEKAALFILTNMRDEKKRLLRTYRKGTAKLNAYVDDYAFLVAGLLALHKTTGEKKWLNAARRLTDDQIRDYWSKVGGGFFFTPHYHEELIARTRNAYDAVEPSGNSVSVRNLIRLAEQTGDDKYREYAHKTIKAFVLNLERTPRGMAHLALAIAEFLQTSKKKSSHDTETPPSKKTSEKAPRKQGVSAAPRTDGSVLQASATDADRARKKKEPAAARAYLSVDKLPVGGTCQIVVFIDVKPGWHINANPPQPKSSVPTTFSLKSQAGVELADVKYPKGHKLALPGFEEPLSVYDGRVAIYGTLKIPATIKENAAADELELRVRYQACDELRCLPPKTIRLKGKLPLAGPGVNVNRINRKLFAKPKRKSEARKQERGEPEAGDQRSDVGGRR